MQNEIKTAAASLFRETGPDFTLDQLQTRTGISRATLYRRIGSKQALLKQIAGEGLIRLDPQENIEGRIFKATRNVVASHGFIACTMEQIANEAGLGIATLYRHFNDKENLLKRFIQNIKPVLAIKTALLSEDGDIEDDLKNLVEITLGFLNDNQDLVKILFSWHSAERAYLSEIRKESGSTFKQIQIYLEKQQSEGALRQDLSAQDLAHGLSALLFQYAVFAPTHNDRPLDLEQDANTIVRLFLDGAGSRDADSDTAIKPKQ